MAEPSRGLLDLVADDDDDFEEEEWGDEGPAAAGAAATSPTPPPPPAVVDSSVATSADNSDSDTGSEPEHNGGAGLSSRARRASGRQRSKQSLALTNVSHHFLSQDSAAADGEEVLSHPDHQPLLTPTTPVSPPLFSRVRMRLAPSNPDDALRRRPYSDFTTINWAREVARERQRQKSLRSVMSTRTGMMYKVVDALQGWLVVFLVGLAAGFVAGIVKIAAPWLADLREGACPQAFWLSREHCCWAEASDGQQSCALWNRWSEFHGSGDGSGAYALDMFVYICFAILFAWLAAFLVKRLAPYASGSGIPEVKTILSGFIIRGYFGMWTLLVKTVGMILAVAAGLSLGKEGPLVHVACCCGNVFSRLFEKYRWNEAKRREVLSAAAAAGVSVAFGAPVGGVLFSLEEVSYYFPHKTMWRSFFAALVAAFVLSLMNPNMSGSIALFIVDYDHPWHWFEAIPFLILGALGGLYGAMFNNLNLRWCAFRRRSVLREYPIFEVVMVALVTAIIRFPNQFSRIPSEELISQLFRECPRENTSPLCTDNTGHTAGLLILACLLTMFITVFTFGIKVPAGLFIPTMAVGATFGRAVGMLTEHVVQSNAASDLVKSTCPDIDICVTPGLYAMVGAAAALGGVTRMTVSLVVIMFELTGALEYIVPLMMAVMVSKWVGDAFSTDGIYDRHIHLAGYPFLDNKEDFSYSTLAEDIMHPKQIGGRRQNELVVLYANDCTVADIEAKLENTTYSGFPVVESVDAMHVVGYVDRKDVADAIRQAREGAVTFDVTESTPCFFYDRSNQAVRENGLDMFDFVHQGVFQLERRAPMSTVVDLFRRMGVRYALVVSKGRLEGIITKKDLLRHLAELSHHDPNAIAFH